MTETRTPDVDTARLVARLAEINAQISELSAQAEEIKAELRALPVGDYADNSGRAFLRIAPTRKFDEMAGLNLIPNELRDACYSRVVDARKVKSLLAPALAETCMVEAGKPKVIVL